MSRSAAEQAVQSRTNIRPENTPKSTPKNVTRQTHPPTHTSRQGLLTESYRMRCPRCRQLYSVAGETLRASAGPLRFACRVSSCQTQYFAKRDSSAASESLITYEIEPSVNAVQVLPSRDRNAWERVPRIAEVRCPKCKAMSPVASPECRSCGILFSKAKLDRHEDEGINERLSMTRRRELIELWEKTLEGYESKDHHERFVKACFSADSLAYAAKKYARILLAAPQEEIARAMQARIHGLASSAIESVADQKARFRMPKLNTLILLMGSVLSTFGVVMPGFKSVAGVGFAALALAIGLRFFLRGESHTS